MHEISSSAPDLPEKGIGVKDRGKGRVEDMVVEDLRALGCVR